MILLIGVSSLAGCVVEDAENMRPRLRLEMASDRIAMNEAREIYVHSVNDLDVPVTVQTDRGCIEIQVWVRSEGGDALFLEGGGASGCTGAPGPETIDVGERLTWGPFTFRPDEWQQQGEPLFAPGDAVPVIADTDQMRTDWSWRNETVIQVTEPIEELTVEVTPEKKVFQAGERVAITARLTNTRDEPYTYTSRDGCNDIHVWVETGGTDEGKVRLYPDMEPYFCPQALTNFTVPPGQSLEVTVHWDGSKGGRGGAPFVAPGTYRIVAVLDGQEDLPSGSGSVAVREPSES